MTSQLIASNRKNAVIVTDEKTIKQKVRELLKKAELPVGVMPVEEVVELGYNPETKFLWAIRKKKREHFFKGINKKATLDTEVTGYLEPRKMRTMTGIKAKELFMWVSLTDFCIPDPKNGKIVFTATMGITKTFPISAFEEPDEEEEEDEKVEDKDAKKVEVKDVKKVETEEGKKVVEEKKVEEANKEVVVKT